MRSGAIFGPRRFTAAVVGFGLSSGLGIACSDFSPARPPIEPQPSVLIITPEALSLAVGAVYPLAIDLRDSDGRSIPVSHIIWSSSVPGVAAADPQGRVKALAAGASVITAQAGRLSKDAPAAMAVTPP